VGFTPGFLLLDRFEPTGPVKAGPEKKPARKNKTDPAKKSWPGKKKRAEKEKQSKTLNETS